MVHQYIYVVHDQTDAHGWQYNADWNTNHVSNFSKENEGWTPLCLAHSTVRRRIWMTTVVAREDLNRSKRLLSENTQNDTGHIYMQGDLLCFEKPDSRSPSAKPRQDYAFSVRNTDSTVGVLLCGDSQETRRLWVLAIHYQLAMISQGVSFPPLEYGPPSGDYPDSRVFLCSNLQIYNHNTNKHDTRCFQLLNREVLYFDGLEVTGRMFLEGTTLWRQNEGNSIQFHLLASDTQTLTLWMAALTARIDVIVGRTNLSKYVSGEEMSDEGISVVDRICQFYDDKWTAPAVDGEDEDYLESVFSAPFSVNPLCEEGYEIGHNMLDYENMSANSLPSSRASSPFKQMQSTSPRRRDSFASSPAPGSGHKTVQQQQN
eukprot:gene32681-40330_t